MKNLPWTNYFIEFLTVVLGILLAFGLNTYYNNRIEEERVSHFLEGVQLEISENALEVKTKLEYHEKIKTALRENPSDVILQLKTPQLKDFAWQIAQDNTISQHISYDLYRKLAEIYSVQTTMNQLGNEASNIMSHVNVVSPFYLIGIELSEEEEKQFSQILKQNWFPIFDDFIDYEKRLAKLYEEVLVMF